MLNYNRKRLSSLEYRLDEVQKILGVCHTSEGGGYRPILNADWNASEVAIMKEKIDLILGYLGLTYEIKEKKFIPRKAILKKNVKKRNTR